MKKISLLFNTRSNQYIDIYKELKPRKLLHQEKKIRAKIVEDLVMNNVTPSAEVAVIDVGCGIGNVLLGLRKNGVNGKMYGVDLSEEMILIAKKRLHQARLDNIEYSTGSIGSLQFKANVVLSIGVTGYQENQEKFLAELCSLVDRNGYLIFTTANGDSFLRLARRYLSKAHSVFTRKLKSTGIEFFPIKNSRVERVLSQQGFKVQTKIYITFGLGIFNSVLECTLDRWISKYLSTNVMGKFLSLTVIHVYKKSV